MSYPYLLGFAHSPASFDFAQRIIASNDQLDHAGPGPVSNAQARDRMLNWIRRSEQHYEARSQHGGLLRIGVEDDLRHQENKTLSLSYQTDDNPSERLGQGTEEALRLMADRFETSPMVFRIVRDAGQFLQNGAF